MINKNFHYFNKYAAMQFANTIATKKPKVEFKNKEIDNLWKKFCIENNFEKKFYELVYKTSLYGTIFFGIYPQTITISNKKEEIPFFTIGIPIYFEKIGCIFSKLEIMIDVIKFNNTDYFIIEKWDKSETSNNKFFVSRSAQDKYGNIKKLSDINYIKLSETEFSKFDLIPYVPFFANGIGENDLFNVEQKLINDFDIHLKLLLSDSIIAKGLVYLNTPNMQGTAENVNSLLKALRDPEATVYQNKNIFSMLQQGGVQIQQGIFNGTGIIEKLRYYELQIKKFSFMKMQSSDLGTKNMHNSETELLNSDADDYVESKANICEENILMWLLIVFNEYLRIFYNLEIDVKKINVEVTGSTKYLQNIKNEYIQNQQGILNNPNKINNLNTNKQKEELNDNESY